MSIWTPQTFREAAKAGKHLYGTLVVSPSSMWPNALRSAGLDFVFIDTEHIALDRTQVSWMCQTYRRMGLIPLARIPSPDPYQATMILDDGACGVIAPYVESVEEVRRLRGAIKLRPLKGRRVQGILDGEPLSSDLQAYVDRFCANNIMIVQIESAAGVEALDAILEVPGIDIVMVGPHDLTTNLGIPEQWDHPKFWEAIGAIFTKARAAGKGAFIHFWGTNEVHVRMMRLGANLISHSSDIVLFSERLRNDLEEIRGAFGDKPGPEPSDALNL